MWAKTLPSNVSTTASRSLRGSATGSGPGGEADDDVAFGVLGEHLPERDAVADDRHRVAGRGIGTAAASLLDGSGDGALHGVDALPAVGSGITGEGLRPLTSAEIDTRLAALPATSAPQPPAWTASPAGESQAVVVSGAPGGTVVVRCEGTTPRIVSASPAQGFELKDSDGDGTRVRFDGDDIEVDVRLSCVNGTPVGDVCVEHDD
ncbi:MAG: hypothetical protein ABS81_23245 [Pseudonocardia sp. SCN 72-86]|nr:MAG: hypothetical protein ABS81_23245 [Pseudonocardia sp. SCN 72-86]